VNPQANKRRRVLVVDDNLDTLHSTALLLRDRGHQVEFAINGTAALTIAQRFRPQVVLLDLVLPDADGADLARRLLRNPELKGVRVIAITGHGEAHRARALQAGCDDFFVKPIAPELLDELLEA
jgi:two-component system, chemotaxis family, CheB/CheR fusion protein